MNRWRRLALMVAASVVAVSTAGSATPSPDAVQTLRGIFATPDDKLDFARAMLVIDRLVDPTIDINGTLRQIDRMAHAISVMAGSNPTTDRKVEAIRKYLDDDGDWNGHRPFQYDHSDPLGFKISNKLLPNYLSSRLGNCVSMPFLFIILADRVGVHVTASTAPYHVFVKLIDGVTGQVENLETTSGGYPARDAWYRENLPMSDKAIQNGVYMKTLTKKETIAVMAEVLVEHDLEAKRYDDAIAIASLILEHYPRFIEAILARGTAYGYLIDDEFKRKYQTAKDIPADLRPRYLAFAKANQDAFETAEALGWRETDGNPPESASAAK